jgi:hypothetical protein
MNEKKHRWSDMLVPERWDIPMSIRIGILMLFFSAVLVLGVLQDEGYIPCPLWANGTCSQR